MEEKSTETYYPGDAASVSEILELALAYHHAAHSLFDTAKRGSALSYAPARLCSIHAVELCLNTFLCSKGIPNSQIRARHHNLADAEFFEVLVLRRKTAKHLENMTEKREYHVTRYGPEFSDQLTEINRLKATLNEVVEKTGKVLAPQAADIAAQ